jgi:hypothetical protein
MAEAVLRSRRGRYGKRAPDGARGYARDQKERCPRTHKGGSVEDLKVYSSAVTWSLVKRLKEDALGLALFWVCATALLPELGRVVASLSLVSYACYILGGVVFQYIEFFAEGEHKNV